MYYIITDINGVYEVFYKSAAEIIADAEQQVYRQDGCYLETYVDIPLIQDSDGDIIFGRNMGEAESFTAAKRFFQDKGRYDVYCAQSDIGEFIWHADEIDMGYEARHLVTEVDPDYARDEFGV